MNVSWSERECVFTRSWWWWESAYGDRTTCAEAFWWQETRVCLELCNPCAFFICSLHQSCCLLSSSCSGSLFSGSNALTCLFHQLFYREEAWGVEMGNDCSESLSSPARGRTGIGILRLFWRHRLFFYQLHAATIAVNPSNPWFQPWIICLLFQVILRNHLILLSLVKLASVIRFITLPVVPLGKWMENQNIP